jgi:hypothetical protein
MYIIAREWLGSFFFKFILDVESSEMNTKSYLPVSSIANDMTDALNDKVGQ